MEEKEKVRIKGKVESPSTPGGRKLPDQIPCRFLYAYGKCNKAPPDGTCAYAHRAPTKNEIREYGYYKSGEGPPKAKGKGKGRCHGFFSTGSCRYGDKCIFSHSDEPAAQPDAVAKAVGKGRKRSKSAAPAVEWDEEDEE